MINSLSGISINIYNFFAIFSSLFYISNSKILVMIILLNTVVYFITYLFLKKLKNLNNLKKLIYFYFISYFLILYSVLGFGLFFEKAFYKKNYKDNIGYVGLFGIFF